MKIYLSSVLVYMIILKSTELFIKPYVIKKNISYNKKNTSGLSIVLVSFIPIIRTIVFIIFLWLFAAKKEDIEKILNKEE